MESKSGVPIDREAVPKRREIVTIHRRKRMYSFNDMIKQDPGKPYIVKDLGRRLHKLKANQMSPLIEKPSQSVGNLSQSVEAAKNIQLLKCIDLRGKVH